MRRARKALAAPACATRSGGEASLGILVGRLVVELQEPVLEPLGLGV